MIDQRAECSCCCYGATISHGCQQSKKSFFVITTSSILFTQNRPTTFPTKKQILSSESPSPYLRLKPISSISILLSRFSSRLPRISMNNPHHQPPLSSHPSPTQPLMTPSSFHHHQHHHHLVDEDDLSSLLPTLNTEEENTTTALVSLSNTTSKSNLQKAATAQTSTFDTSASEELNNKQTAAMDSSHVPISCHEEDTFLIPQIPMNNMTTTTSRKQQQQAISSTNVTKTTTTMKTHPSSSSFSSQQHHQDTNNNRGKSSSCTQSNHVNSVSSSSSTRPLTLMVKYINSNNGKELYSTLIRMEKYPESLELVQQVTLKRWNDKCEIVNSNLQSHLNKHQTSSQPSTTLTTSSSSIWKKREEPFSRIRVQCTDRFNSRIQLDLDNMFLKDFNLKENDLLWVLV